MKKLRLAQTMMIATISLIVAFQAYYIYRLYYNEWKDVKKETDVLFRETVYKLQVARFKKDTTFLKRISTDNVFNVQAVNVIKNTRTRVKELKRSDSSLPQRTIVIAMTEDSLRHREFPEELRMRLDSLGVKNNRQIRIITSRQENTAVQILTHNNIPKDSARVVIRNFDTTIRREFVRALPRPKDVTAPQLKRTFVDIRKEHKLSQNGAPISDNLRSDKTVRFRTPLSDDPEIRIFSDTRSLNDSLPISQLDSAYKNDLKKASITIPFSLAKTTGKKPALSPKENELRTNVASVGLLTPYHYQATFASPFYFLIQKIAPNILFSVLLVGFTIGSFVVLYRNLLSQRRLGEIKNEFISNITHELKTPIATVNVAIEAMKNFNALHNPERTKEYLDISQSELQRLSLLVDKVLRLSMFEKKEIELKKELFNIEELAQEVIGSMKLQFEKLKAKVSLKVTGEKLEIEGDRLHITSVIYNLLDNALKYSNHNSEIGVDIISHEQFLEIQVSDTGIGIANEYKSKVFEQFFRVPNDNKHNTKGYGLGLSYVKHVVQQHQGFIEVESELGKGSTFTVKLPYKEAPVINYDGNRRIRKEL